MKAGMAVASQSPAAPGWVYESLLPYLCGKELDREGKISALTVARQLEVQAVVEQRLEKLRVGADSPVDLWDRFLKWKFFSDSRTRTISPESTLTVPEYVERSLRGDEQPAQRDRSVPPLNPGGPSSGGFPRDENEQKRDRSSALSLSSALSDEAKLHAVWLSAPSHPLVQWALGKSHSGGAWGTWLRDRASLRIAAPETESLYGADAAARWRKTLSASTADGGLPGAGFTNSLGMKFAPVTVSGGRNVLFGVWETRVKDYAAYADNQPGVDESWKNLIYKNRRVSPTEDCPVAAVTWEDANSFCNWLTLRERELGKITSRQRYRLPTDEEWSWAVGIGEEEEEALRGGSPKDKDSKVDAYPWGTLKYPPVNDEGKPLGNYADSEFQRVFPDIYPPDAMQGYSDGYSTTAPVAVFPPGAHGLYDMGGNVAEWCEDIYEEDLHVIRGASWYYSDHTSLLSSCRFSVKRPHAVGFRCVLADDSSAP